MRKLEYVAIMYKSKFRTQFGLCVLHDGIFVTLSQRRLKELSSRSHNWGKAMRTFLCCSLFDKTLGSFETGDL